jgi:hypothetical protein
MCIVIFLTCLSPNEIMCETLDEIHELQLASVIARMRKQRAQMENSMVLTS